MVGDIAYFVLVQQSAWISGVISLVMTWQMGNKRWWAPLLGLVGQVFWVALAWYTNQPGLGLTVAVYTFVHLRNARKWMGERNVQRV